MEYRKFTNDELIDILDKHEKWLNNEEGGEQADLSNTYIDNVAYTYNDSTTVSLLCKYNLTMANMSGSVIAADQLIGTIFSFCNMNNVRIKAVIMKHVSFYDAILTNSFFDISLMSGCDFRNADLSDSMFSDMRSSNIYLEEAKIDRIQGLNDICPNGTLIGYKKSGDGYIVELEIPADAKRCSAFGRKCRCSKAKIISITSIDGNESYQTARSYYRKYHVQHDSGEAIVIEDPALFYKVGEVVKPDWFDDNFWQECSNGIHFFLTREEAVNYKFG